MTNFDKLNERMQKMIIDPSTWSLWVLQKSISDYKKIDFPSQSFLDYINLLHIFDVQSRPGIMGIFQQRMRMEADFDVYAGFKLTM